MKVLPMLLALAVPGLCWAEEPQTFEGAGVVFEVQVEKNLVDIDHRLYRLPNSTVRNGMPSLFQVKPAPWCPTLAPSASRGPPSPISTFTNR